MEGGRHRVNKRWRKQSYRTERAAERRYVRLALRGDDPDECIGRPWRPKVYKGFDDKLAPAARWLRSRAGRPWAEVEGEIFRTFDTRSLAGRHIVFGHLLPPPWNNPRDGSWVVCFTVGRFWVDEAGVLRNGPLVRWVHPPYLAEEPSRAAAAFVGERRVGLHGTRRYWLVPTGNGWGGLRQDRELLPAEAAVFEAFSDEDRGFISRRLS